MEVGLLRRCTSEIVAAYVRRNQTPTAEISTLMQTVHDALTNLGTTAVAVEIGREPAVPIRRSLRPDAVICLDCGFRGKMIRRHLLSVHQLSPEEYRFRWGLPFDYPMTAPNYSKQRSVLAKDSRLGHREHVTEAIAPPVQESAPEPTPEPKKNTTTKKPAVRRRRASRKKK